MRARIWSGWLSQGSRGRRMFVALLFAVVMVASSCSRTETETPDVADGSASRVRLAVLGDSDSHSYGDRIWFSPGSDLRGGQYRQKTLQWTEVMAELRPDEIDQGPWGSWGTNPRIARIGKLIGVSWRAPRKEDFQFNFAVTGATCRNLIQGTTAQTPQLLDLMQRRPELWRAAVVQIRIGINTLGTREFLDRSASLGMSGAVAREAEDCANAVVSAAQAIRSEFPSVRIVLVGVLNNSDWPPFFGYWQSAVEQRNINSVLDAFDARLAAAASADAGMAFFDDRAWFARHWGTRDSSGMPAYKSVRVTDDIMVSNSRGNEHSNAILADGHGGTLLNAIWTRDFIGFLNDRFDFGLTPVTEDELAELANILYKNHPR